MKQLSIIYIITLYTITFLFLGENNIVFAQQDSNAVINELKIDQNTSQKNNNENEKLTINISEEVGINSLKDLSIIEKILVSLIIFLVGFYLLKMITKILQFFDGRSTQKRIPFKGFIPIIRLLVWAIIIYIILGFIIQPPFGILIAISVFVGLAAGLASQDLMKNIFGGIIILFDLPFRVGDKIKVGDNYGEVLTIGLRFTRIVTSDDSVVSIPNSTIINQQVANSNSGEPNCQVVAEIYLPIDIDTVAVRDMALEVARISKYVYLNKPISVLFFNEVKEKRSFLKMRLKAYVMDIKYEFEFKSEMTELIFRELLNEGLLKKEDVS
jgi:small-conductance mechanosensitive channel